MTELKSINELNEPKFIWQRVADFLNSTGAFSAYGVAELIETHISMVFLTEQYVYKLKKPVRFDFLDYSTVSARKRSCEQEVLLNRRLAANVYLGVLPVTADVTGALAIDGQGEPVEWLVKMRRLPAELMMDRILDDQKKPRVDIGKLCEVLTNFYLRAPSLSITAEAYAHQLAEHVQRNRAELLRRDNGLPESLIKRIHGRQLQFITFESALFASRTQDGRVVDGHGDLRPEHICLEVDPVIFDCVEFSEELRQVDPIDELSFLAMECDRLGLPEYGDTVINHYAKSTNDFVPRHLIDFYKSYRACVRAKVSVLRALQSQGEVRENAKLLAYKYLSIADRSLGWAGAPQCVITRGFVGTGKSTIASELSETLGMDLLQSDALRQKISREAVPLNLYGAGVYQLDKRREVYEFMFALASATLSEGISVVLDACFLTQDLQQSVLYLAEALGVALVVVNCQCPSDVAVARIIQRLHDASGLSDAKPEYYAQQAHDDEGIFPGLATVAIDTSKGTTQSHLQLVFEALRKVAISVRKLPNTL